MIRLKTVRKNDLQFLYTVLQNRNPNVNISHRKIPTFEQHKKFVLSKPYSKWYIIYKNNVRVGSIYLSKQNEIGIFLIKKFQKIGIGDKAMDMLISKNPRKRYLANINPKNYSSAKFFKNHNFKMIQHTYELIKRI